MLSTYDVHLKLGFSFGIGFCCIEHIDAILECSLDDLNDRVSLYRSTEGEPLNKVSQ